MRLSPHILDEVDLKIDEYGLVARAHQNPAFRGLAVFLSRHYTALIATLGVLMMAVQVAEHFFQRAGTLLFLIIEITLTLFFLFVTWALTRMLMSSNEQRFHAMNTLRIKHNLNLQLSAAQNLAEVAHRLVQQLSIILPAAGIDLFLFDKDREVFYSANRITFSLDDAARADAGRADAVRADAVRADAVRADAARADSAGEAAGREAVVRAAAARSGLAQAPAGPCHYCLMQEKPGLQPFEICRQSRFSANGAGARRYCLPLYQADQPAGLLHINTGERGLTEAQTALLENLWVEMSSGLLVAMEKKISEDERMAQQAHELQLDLARDLHDTLGQNISYIRMKLDHLVETGRHTSPHAAEEVRRMYEVANESYDLMRGTLSVLHSGRQVNMLDLFERYAKQIGDRSEFVIEFAEQGEPHEISSNQARQLFYIFREALSNIEKHAQARRVCVSLGWSAEGFDLRIEDDGRGFNADGPIPIGHYGVKFMQERARNLHGCLSIHSAPGSGTTIQVHIPWTAVNDTTSAENMTLASL